MGTFGVLSSQVLSDLITEANRAHDKHVAAGGSLLDPGLSTERRLAALGEEFGEVCRELTYDNAGDKNNLYKELIQVANIAISWAEYIRTISQAILNPWTEEQAPLTNHQFNQSKDV